MKRRFNVKEIITYGLESSRCDVTIQVCRTNEKRDIKNDKKDRNISFSCVVIGVDKSKQNKSVRSLFHLCVLIWVWYMCYVYEFMNNFLGVLRDFSSHLSFSEWCLASLSLYQVELTLPKQKRSMSTKSSSCSIFRLEQYPELNNWLIHIKSIPLTSKNNRCAPTVWIDDIQK